LSSPGQYASGDMIFQTTQTSGNMLEGFRLTSQQEVLVGTTTDNGAYSLQVGGNGLYASTARFPNNSAYGFGSSSSTTIGGSIQGYTVWNTNTTPGVGSGYVFGGVTTAGNYYPTAIIWSINTPESGTARGDLAFATVESGNYGEGFRLTSAKETLFGTTSDAGDYRVQVNGNAYLQNGQMFFNQVTNKSAIFVSQYSVTGSASSNMVGATATWNTTGNPNLINIDLTNTASGATANYINISDGTNTFRVNKSAEIFTSAPTGGSSKGWRLGEVATVTPTSPNRTIRVEIDGVVYYIHAKTTND